MNPTYNPNIPVAVPLDSAGKDPYGHSPSASAAAYAVSTPVTTVTASAPVPAQKLPTVQNDGSLREFLQNQGWTSSMQDFFVQSLEKVPLRFFICDDSGSMGIDDGEKIASYGNVKKMVKCTRWAELTDALRFHSELAFTGKVPTEFRFLNAVHPLKIGYELREPRDNLDTLRRVCDGSPNGGTPLCHHIREITTEIAQYAQVLRQAGQVACVVIATDGEASDGDVAEALRPLKALPVMVVLRLCTNEERIVSYWNKVDEDLELNMDVLDDLAGEADEVGDVNPWLTYGEPLHRMREFGVHMKEMDLLDEDLLSLDNFKRIAKLFYGSVIDTFAPPEIDLKQFLTSLKNHQANLPKVWNPKKKEPRHWVDVKDAGKAYGKGKGGCAIM